jgi:hypothetical protein
MIPRKKKLCKGCETEQYIFSHGLCKYCSQNKTKNKTMSKRKRFMSYPTNKKEDKADKLFSIIVRRLGSDKSGMCKCFTCDTTRLWKHMQCGHFIPRQHLTTRWLLENAKPQCKMCNELEGGRYDEFKIRLEAESPGITTFLENLKHTVIDKSTYDLDEIIKNLKEIEAKLNAKEREVGNLWHL